MANYYNLIRDCIHSVRDEVQGKHGTVLQLHERQCSYVLEELSKVLESLQSRLDSSLKRDDDVHRRNVVLLHLHGAVKRAQKLVDRCCIQNLSSSWLAAAMTLVNITEEVIAILLDLHQWTTSLLEITLIGAGSHEIEMRTKPLEAGEVGSNHHLLEGNHLHSSNHPLQIAALQDREDLVEKIANYSGKHTSHEDPDYILGVYLESQLMNHSEQQRPDESIQQRLRDSYTYLGVLGYGASGMVLEVKWMGQQVALKISDTIDEPEATMLKQLHHPNIIQFFHYGEDPTIPRSYIFMDRMSTNLQKHIKNLKVSKLQSSLEPRSKDLRPFSLPVAIDIMGQVAEAMRHLHDKNLVHRDLKTSNILVKQVSDSMLELHTQGYLEVKLADFGLPKAYANSSIFEELSRKGGTTVYGAPEIYGSEQNSDINFPLKADVWSFGMICSEILTGIEPFVDEKPIKTLHDRISHNGVRPSLPQDCPSYLRICITRCWSLDPARRPSFSELCEMLRHAKLLSLELGQPQDIDQIYSTLARGMRTVPPR
jgi:serine/threonine protein kinase